MTNSLSLQTHDILRMLFSFIASLKDLSRSDLMFICRGFPASGWMIALKFKNVLRLGILAGMKKLNNQFLQYF